MSKLNSNEGINSPITVTVTQILPPKPSSEDSKLFKYFFVDERIVNSTMTHQMQESAIDVIRKAIADGTDEEDIKSIIVDELIRIYGGVWRTYITPKIDSHGFMPQKLCLSIKIDNSVMRK